MQIIHRSIKRPRKSLEKGKNHKMKLVCILLIIIIILLIVGCSPLKFIEDKIKKEEVAENNYPTKEEVAEEKARQDEINIIACIKLLPECENEL